LRRGHFRAFAPHCPRCAAAGAGRHALVLAAVLAERGEDVLAGLLHCPNPACRHEYPIIDGIPVILPELPAHLAAQGLALMLRADLDPALESLLGDAIGPDSWFDALRQQLSTYGWDAWADLDPAEPLPTAEMPVPGAARRCLARLLELSGGARPVARALDVGCGAGRTSFDLAARPASAGARRTRRRHRLSAAADRPGVRPAPLSRGPRGDGAGGFLGLRRPCPAIRAGGRGPGRGAQPARLRRRAAAPAGRARSGTDARRATAAGHSL
jgi:uncharacterized protein YbaR (Trm112 family)